MGDFDQFADSYQRIHTKNVRITGENSEYFAEYKARYVARQMGPQFSGRILDYGCGVGMLSRYMKRILPGAAVDGYDISDASLAKVDSEIRVKGAFTSDWSRVNGPYDLIVVANVMHHVPPDQRQGTIAGIRDKLAPQGRLIIVEHNPLNPLTRSAVAHCEFDDDAILLHPAEGKGYLLRSGLEVLRRDYIVFFPHFLSWFRRAEPFLDWCPAGAQYALVAQRGADV